MLVIFQQFRIGVWDVSQAINSIFLTLNKKPKLNYHFDILQRNIRFYNWERYKEIIKMPRYSSTIMTLNKMFYQDVWISWNVNGRVFA